MSNDIEKLEDIKKRIENLENSYNDMLDELYAFNVGSLTYTGSRVLKAVDPIAYTTGFDDYIDSEISEIKDELEEINIDNDNNDNEKELKNEIEEMLNEYGY